MMKLMKFLTQFSPHDVLVEFLPHAHDLYDVAVFEVLQRQFVENVVVIVGGALEQVSLVVLALDAVDDVCSGV